MADTEFSALASTNTIAASDSILLVRGGVAYRFSGTLPAVDSAGALTAAGAVSVTKATSSAIREDGFKASRPGLASSYGFLSFSGDTAYVGGVYSGGVKANVVIRVSDGAADTDVAMFTAGGNMLVGTTSGSNHIIRKNVTADAGNLVIELAGTGGSTIAAFYGVSGYGANAANSAMKLGKDNVTGRSQTAGGSLNASGADYAEYMTKADGCGPIAKGQVCGINAAGLLTLAWSEAIAHMVKSTDPNLVGGDRWDRHVGPRPEAPAPLRREPVAPEAPVAFTEPTPEAEEGEDAGTFSLRVAAWNGRRLTAEQAAAEHAAAMGAFAEDHAAWIAEREAFEAAQAQYEIDLPAWEVAHEAARQRVDRIAYSGQVPVIVTGAFAPGDYIIAAEGDDDSIIAVAVPAADITFDQYRRRIGKVLAVTEDDPDGRWPAGRAWVDVQHG
jgi:hypothetical protein